ncbi:PAS domain S-box protein [bacterium]|nr:PAS domain S-box protein [bacterium]
MDDLTRKVHAFLDYLPGALIEIEFSSQNIIYMNRMAFFLFGHSQSDVDQGIPARNIFFDDSEYGRARKVAESYGLENYQNRTAYSRHKQQALYDFKMLKKDGTVFLGESQGSFVLDADKVPIGARIYIRDLSEQRAVEAALLESEERFRNAFEQATIGRVIINFFGTFTMVNEALCRMLGYSESELLEMSLSDITHPSELEESNDFARQLISGTLKADSLIHRFIHKDGETVWVDQNFVIVRDIAGDPIYAVGDIVDITELKAAEAELVETNALKELLLDIITHDLKNPASTIYSMSEMLKIESPDNEYIDLIYLSSTNLLQVLEDTSTLSQATFGEYIPKESLNLNVMLTELAKEFRSYLKEEAMELILKIPEGLIITANPLIAEVFKNYISNAIKYASKGKSINVTAKIEDNSVLVSVSDLGVTIPQENRLKIFDRSAQLASGQKPGRGLGLAIVKRLASAHDGTVWVEPNSPRGNIFCLSIPHML